MAHAKATILCIGYHFQTRLGHRFLLKKKGYKVLEAGNPSDGLKLFLSQPVDVVILDQQVPGVEVEILAPEMKSLKPSVPILLLSESAPPLDSMPASIDGFFTKSDTARHLLSTLHNLLEGWSKPFFFRWLDHWKGRNQGVRL